VAHRLGANSVGKFVQAPELNPVKPRSDYFIRLWVLCALIPLSGFWAGWRRIGMLSHEFRLRQRLYRTDRTYWRSALSHDTKTTKEQRTMIGRIMPPLSDFQLFDKAN
jgi:hypothetical protein